jgi:hypothetical protein
MVLAELYPDARNLLDLGPEPGPPPDSNGGD